MDEIRDVAVLVGSLRKESFTRKLANAMIVLAPDSLALEIVEIGDLQLYNQDFDEGYVPPEWTTFRDRIRRADAVLFATPEYNRSVPAPLKNAIDVGSRPRGRNSFDGKPGAVISVSLGALGAFGANHHLRQSLVYLNVPTMQQPEAYISGVAELFDTAGAISKDATRTFLETFLTAFAAWIEMTRRVETTPRK
jgi:chromate reductase, NAD(P)H dehydrogenase (quinone)